MNPHGKSIGRRGFTLTELLTVIGLLSLLVSLLMPVASKVRAAARNTGCSSHLRQMTVAWTVYVMDNHGRLPDYMWQSRAGAKGNAWYGYWPGILAKNGVPDELLLCPAAREEPASDRSAGFGDVTHAWTGRHIPVPNGSGVRLDANYFRVSSYGYNQYLAVDPTKKDGAVSRLADLKTLSDVPVFFDCAYADARPVNRTESVPAQPPPNLRGEGLTAGSPHHWRFLLGRHGRGINVATADGQVRWVRLEETYLLTWNAGWTPHRLRLPAK